MSEKITHLDQYKMLREEIMQNIREISQLQIAAVLSNGAIYPWLIVHRNEVGFRAVWFIAPVIMVVCAVKCIDLVARMKIIANYLRHLEEDAFCDSQLPGWERYLMSRSWKFYDKAALTGATIAWIVAIGSSTWGAWYFSSQPKVTVESVSPPLGSSQGRSAVSPTGGTPQPVVPPSGDRSAQNPNGQGEGN